uniref:Putative polysaccharide biosynthesis protein n=1 Tax=viral metagenome TaxID=1070528 RepID=A0A6H1ZW11_9ZZZZ
MKDKTILLTGGTGSLGQELIRQLLPYEPKSIRIYSRGEWAQQDMSQKFNDSRLRFMIGDVRDKDRLMQVMTGCDIIIHTAALKQVPTCDYNPTEAIKTNIIGSVNVVEAAISNKVDKVIAISSDKAVHPVNIYGASKLVMEKLLLQASNYTKTKLACIRFGNFNQSRGNVFELWKHQLETTGEITVTEPEMVRFWIHIGDAASFVIQCLDMMQGGEIYIPKMPSITLKDLIPEGTKVKVTGQRAGERMTEYLFGEAEKPIDKGDYYIIGG